MASTNDNKSEEACADNNKLPHPTDRQWWKRRWHQCLNHRNAMVKCAIDGCLISIAIAFGVMEKNGELPTTSMFKT